MDIQKFNIIDNNLLFNDIDNELELEWEKFFDESTTVFSYDGDPVGIMNASEHELFPGLYIEQFEVFNSCKGNGYGTAIIKEVIQNYNDCYVYPESKKAKKFWEKLGFVQEDDGSGTSIWHLNNQT